LELLRHSVRDLILAGEWADHIGNHQPETVARNFMVIETSGCASGRGAPGWPPRAGNLPFQPGAVLEGRGESSRRYTKSRTPPRPARA
jgi:hypothetical protein